jgi:hypothetical protein
MGLLNPDLPCRTIREKLSSATNCSSSSHVDQPFPTNRIQLRFLFSFPFIDEQMRSCSFLTPLALNAASLLATQVTAFSCPLSESFAATVNCNDDSYENQCNVGGGSDYTSCECALNPGYYHVCTSNCNDYNFRKDGICVQCFAGSYFTFDWGIQCGTSGQPNCCGLCPTGTFSTQGQSACTNCPTGTTVKEDRQINALAVL